MIGLRIYARGFVTNVLIIHWNTVCVKRKTFFSFFFFLSRLFGGKQTRMEGAGKLKEKNNLLVEEIDRNVKFMRVFKNP